MLAASRPLQGLGASEPVGAQAAAPPLRPRLESPRPHSFGHLRRLGSRLGDEGAHLLDLDDITAREVDDLQLDFLKSAPWARPAVHVQGRGRTKRVESDLQVAPTAGQRAAALVVDDPPASLGPINPIDDAAKGPSVDRRAEWMLEKFGSSL